MFYAQSAAKGHTRVKTKQNVFLSQVTILIHNLPKKQIACAVLQKKAMPHTFTGNNVYLSHSGTISMSFQLQIAGRKGRYKKKKSVEPNKSGTGCPFPGAGEREPMITQSVRGCDWLRKGRLWLADWLVGLQPFRLLIACLSVGTMGIDRLLMFYAQSTAKGHISAKQNVFLPGDHGT